MAFKFVGKFFAVLGKGVWQRVKNFVTSDATKALLKTAQGKIVEAVVGELQDFTNLTSEQKRAEALKRIASASEEAGVEFKESVSRLILEIVVARLKGAE